MASRKQKAHRAKFAKLARAKSKHKGRSSGEIDCATTEKR